MRRGPSTGKRVALTFDDGPDQLTPRSLDLLDELTGAGVVLRHRHAVQRPPELVQGYLPRGHHIASHGYDHTRFTELGRKALLDQCRKTDRVLGAQLEGRAWVRPPHGAVDASGLLSLRAAGYTVALWSVDSKDYEDRDPNSSRHAAPQTRSAPETCCCSTRASSGRSTRCRGSSTA